jgi:hypothetical protein
MCAGVQEGLEVEHRGPSRCLGAEEAWVSSGCSVLALCVSGFVGLDRPPSGETFWSLLGYEGAQLQGLTRGPESPRAPEGGIESLSSCVTPRT